MLCWWWYLYPLYKFPLICWFTFFEEGYFFPLEFLATFSEGRWSNLMVKYFYIIQIHLPGMVGWIEIQPIKPWKYFSSNPQNDVLGSTDTMEKSGLGMVKFILNSLSINLHDFRVFCLFVCFNILETLRWYVNEEWLPSSLKFSPVRLEVLAVSAQLLSSMSPHYSPQCF